VGRSMIGVSKWRAIIYPGSAADLIEPEPNRVELPQQVQASGRDNGEDADEAVRVVGGVVALRRIVITGMQAGSVVAREEV
jgi:hypothetical protein